MIAWSTPARNEHIAPRKTEYQSVIEQLANVAAQLTAGNGNAEALKKKRAELITRFYQLKEFKLPD